ncbi:hypothetical protein GCM10028817_19460 [Spirosoma pomorum]
MTDATKIGNKFFFITFNWFSGNIEQSQSPAPVAKLLRGFVLQTSAYMVVKTTSCYLLSNNL